MRVRVEGRVRVRVIVKVEGHSKGQGTLPSPPSWLTDRHKANYGCDNDQLDIW